MTEHPTAKPLRLGIVASMKRGLEQFIYRELTHLEQTGVEVVLYPTKCGPGLYEPRETWHVQRWTYLAVILMQMSVFWRQPIRYCKALLTALRHRALADFLLAAYFSRSMQTLDAIYCTFGDRKLFVGFFAKMLLDKPLMCTTHAYEIYQNPNPDLFRVAIAACDQLITISEYNRRQLQERFGYAEQDIEVVPCSIDLNEYRPAEKPTQKFVILIVGFFVARKGHEVLFQALQRLNNPALEVWVVGGKGAESDSVDVERLAKQHGLESQVAFFGKLSGAALRATYHACDVFCLPCHFDGEGVGEGFPTVIIEAMACGKPVISTRHVAIPDILDQVLVEERDVEGLAVAIEQMYTASLVTRRAMGLQNRALAEKHFSPSNVEKTAAIARRLCEREHAAPTQIISLPAQEVHREDQPRDSEPATPAAEKRPAGSASSLMVIFFTLVFSNLRLQATEPNWLEQLPAATRQSILWSANHESGSLSEWSYPKSKHPGGGILNTGEREAVAIATSAQAHSGKFSVQASIQGAYHARNGVRAVRLMRWADGPIDQGGRAFPAQAYYSTWMRIPQTYNPNKNAPWDPGDGGWWNVFQFKAHDRNDVSQPMWTLNIGYDDRSREMSFYLYSPPNLPSAHEQESPQPLPINTWFHVEAYYQATADRQGAVTVWQDGREILHVEKVQTLSSETYPAVVWGIGNYTDHIAPAGKSTLFFDDAIVSTQRISRTFAFFPKPKLD